MIKDSAVRPKLARLAVAWLLHACWASAAAQPAMKPAVTVAICDDEKEWPPFLYIQRSGKNAGKLVGYSIDVIDAIFSAHRMAYTIDLLPWARCLSEVGIGKRYQMALNLVRTDARDKLFHMTRPYYAVHNHYFYSRKQHPDGLEVRKVADLRRYKACGILNYDQSDMGFKPGEVDQGSRTYDALIGKLRMDRCTLFVLGYENMVGFSAINLRYFDDPDIGHAPIPGVKPSSYSMAISRDMPGGAALKVLLDRELARMEASGRLYAVLQQYLPQSKAGIR